MPREELVAVHCDGKGQRLERGGRQDLAEAGGEVGWEFGDEDVDQGLRRALLCLELVKDDGGQLRRVDDGLLGNDDCGHILNRGVQGDDRREEDEDARESEGEGVLDGGGAVLDGGLERARGLEDGRGVVDVAVEALDGAGQGVGFVDDTIDDGLEFEAQQILRTGLSLLQSRSRGERGGYDGCREEGEGEDVAELHLDSDILASAMVDRSVLRFPIPSPPSYLHIHCGHMSKEQ